MTPQQREQEFDLHISRAQRAERENRIDDAMREYTAALKLQPGDPAALKGRAYLRYKRTKEGQCPKRAIEDLRLLRTYDPRGLWLEQRGTLVTWLGPLRRAHRRRAPEPRARGRRRRPEVAVAPYDIRFVIAQLQSARPRPPSVSASAGRCGGRAAAARQLPQGLRGHRPSPAAEALRLQATLYREADDFESAIQIYEELIRRYPGTALAKQAKKSVDDLKLEVELDKLEKEQGGKPSQAAEAAYTEATRRCAPATSPPPSASWSGRHRRLAVVPQGPLRARHHPRAGGRFPKAAEELKISIRMDRFDYEAHMALGLLYKKEFAGAEDEQAIKHLDDRAAAAPRPLPPRLPARSALRPHRPREGPPPLHPLPRRADPRGRPRPRARPPRPRRAQPRARPPRTARSRPSPRATSSASTPSSSA
jgi:tetratricopeptide (TPR) repeat protein